MKVTVIAKNIELTPALREMVEKKISKLEKYFEDDVEAKAILKVQKNRHNIEVLIPFNGILLRAEETTDDMYKAIDKVEDKLTRQIRKQRTRLDRRKNGSLRFAEIATDSYEEEDEGKVVKTKTFAVKPMDVDEAILQMELIGHSFFVFQNADTSKINVVYKRKDGDYGLLEPDYK